MVCTLRHENRDACDMEIVVVLAFKAVYTLEQKRRDNEKKIIALYVEMKDMMGVLLLYVQTYLILLCDVLISFSASEK